MELALYAPDVGFYESGGRHFLTSPEVGPLFGAVLARALDEWWDGLGRPDPFVVVEAAAGRGALCRAVLDASPACLGALRYVLVERSERLRAEQAKLVPVEASSDVLGPVYPPDEEDEEGARVLPGRGPRVASLPDLPAGPLTAVIIANELLDNLPFALVEWDGACWMEVRVGANGEEVLVPASAACVAEATKFAGGPGLPPGSRAPLQGAAAAWVREAIAQLDRGRLVVIDYASTTEELSRRSWLEWVRTYRGGGRGGLPLDRPGTQDVTCEVCVDQLAARVRAPAIDRSQAEFLAAHGMGELVDDARAHWRSTAAAGGLESLRSRSRISEGEALSDLAGLGSFRVLEWVVE